MKIYEMNNLCQVEFNTDLTFENLMNVIIHINRIKENSTISSR